VVVAAGVERLIVTVVGVTPEFPSTTDVLLIESDGAGMLPLASRSDSSWLYPSSRFFSESIVVASADAIAASVSAITSVAESG